MNIDSIIRLNDPAPSPERLEKIRQEKTADKFEELFARHLVREMTKNSFQMADNQMGTGNGNSLYREFVTDALAAKLASQRQLGLADLLEQHWDRKQNSPDETGSGSSTGGPVDLGGSQNTGSGMLPVEIMKTARPKE
jgi:Rod binding domain-containing protein